MMRLRAIVFGPFRECAKIEQPPRVRVRHHKRDHERERAHNGACFHLKTRSQHIVANSALSLLFTSPTSFFSLFPLTPKLNSTESKFFHTEREADDFIKQCDKHSSFQQKMFYLLTAIGVCHAYIDLKQASPGFEKNLSGSMI
jgi:hypothetical protein